MRYYSRTLYLPTMDQYYVQNISVFTVVWKKSVNVFTCFPMICKSLRIVAINSFNHGLRWRVQVSPELRRSNFFRINSSLRLFPKYSLRFNINTQLLDSRAFDLKTRRVDYGVTPTRLSDGWPVGRTTLLNASDASCAKHTGLTSSMRGPYRTQRTSTAMTNPTHTHIRPN